MNQKFFDLKKEKQDRMINGALKCFAINGYKRASTDEMVKEAGISKGLLFHYFGSKMGVYTFVYEYSARYTAMELARAVRKQETDFFEIQKQMEGAKMQIMKNYPYMQAFINRSFLEEDAQAVSEVGHSMDLVSENLQKLYAQADLSDFIEGADPSKILKMVLFTVDGLMNERMNGGEWDPKVLYRETVGYLEMMKECFYK